MSTALIDLAERDARIGWVEQRVAIIDEHHRQGAWLSAEEGDLVMPFLESRGLSSMLFVPIGVAETCLGSMALTRRPGDPPWSSAELETGLDIGHDLGHAIREARAHRREQELLTELREIDAYKSQLIATVSHELRNPLSAVSGHLEMIRATHDELPRDVERSLEAMERGTRRLGRTIADLLLYSEVGDPSRDFAPATVDLGRVVRDVRDLHEISARRHRQRVVVDVPPGEVPVRGVADDLDGVVSNLLSNALKYSPDGSTVTLIVRHDEREVTLLCCDEGVGVAEDEREAVFGEFFRSTDATVRREDGTGARSRDRGPHRASAPGPRPRAAGHGPRDDVRGRAAERARARTCGHRRGGVGPDARRSRARLSGPRPRRVGPGAVDQSLGPMARAPATIASRIRV